MSKYLEQEISKYIIAFNMIAPDDKVIAGVSGGKDSICLLTVLHKLSKDWNFSLFAVHVNHMIRGAEAERDKEFVKEYCKNLGIPCMAVNTDVKALAESKGLGLEEAGRLARSIVFEEAAKKLFGNQSKYNCKIALGHHRDDNVETIILNLTRGSGLTGITGMAPKIEKGQLTIIRPLLCVGREDIEEYIADNHLQYVNDATNFSDDYARNKIRLNIIPELARVNSRVSEHINDMAGRLTQIEEYLEKQIDAAMAGIVDQRDDGVFSLDILKLKAEDPAIRTGIVYKCIGKACGTLKDISHVHISDVISLMDKQTGRKIELPYGLTATRSYGSIRIAKYQQPEMPKIIRADYENNDIRVNLSSHIDISMNEIRSGGREIVLKDGGKVVFEIVPVTDKNREFLMQNNFYTKAFDCDTIKGTLILGRPEADDEIKFAGGTKQLKKYFTDEKIPAEIRNQLLVLKDVNGVIWVLGYRIGEQYKITERTQSALIVTVIGGNNG